MKIAPDEHIERRGGGARSIMAMIAMHPEAFSQVLVHTGQTPTTLRRTAAR